MNRYRYILRHTVSSEDRETLESALEDEPGFRLGELAGADAIAEMLRALELEVDVTRSQRFFGFGPSIEAMSVYLPEYVSGVEVVEERDALGRTSRIECWRYIGRRGELLVVPLLYALTPEREVVPGTEDVSRLRAQWPQLPLWARNAYKLTYAELGDLSS